MVLLLVNVLAEVDQCGPIVEIQLLVVGTTNIVASSQVAIPRCAVVRLGRYIKWKQIGEKDGYQQPIQIKMRP